MLLKNLILKLIHHNVYGGQTMAEAVEKGELRFKDLISLAMEGKKVNASIELKKQVITQKVHPADTEEMKAEI